MIATAGDITTSNGPQLQTPTVILLMLMTTIEEIGEATFILEDQARIPIAISWAPKHVKMKGGGKCCLHGTEKRVLRCKVWNGSNT